MERIGIVASKIARGNLFLYNLFVVLLILLFSVLVFLICAAALLLIFIIVDYLQRVQISPELYQGWIPFIIGWFSSLGLIIAVFALFALLKNIKFKKK